MKTLKLISLMLALLFAACGGGSDDPITPNPTPTPTPTPPEKVPTITITSTETSPVMEQTGGETTVEFTTDAAWTVSVAETRAVSWITVEPTSGGAGTHTLTITTVANDTPDERNATVTLKAGTTTQTFTVSQKQQDALTVTSNKVEMSAGGGEALIEVQANISYEYEIEESAKSWITSTDTRGLTTTTIKLQVSENEEFENREGKVTVHSGEFSEVVTVYQEGATPSIVLTRKEYSVGSAGETIKVELKSNVDYEVGLPEEGWITESTTRAFSSHTHYFNVVANDTYDARTAVITFINKENGIEEQVTVSQAQQDAIVVAENEYSFGAKGGKLDFTANANVDFTVSISADWITQVTTRGLTEKSLHFDVAENTSEEAREATIMLAAGELKQVITVKQTLNTESGGNIDDMPTQEW